MKSNQLIIARKPLFLVFMLGISLCSVASVPDCTGKDAWPAAMAFTFLKNEKLLDSDTTVFSKTTVSRIASEKISKDLYRQVHLVRYVKTDGTNISAMTVNEASSQECSMSGVDVYVVDKKIGDYTK